jgi:hypothetical protein
MIHVVKRFQHYLLGNSFIFYVDHQTLLYLVNKMVLTSWIDCQLLLLQEFDFKVIYKPKRVHFLPNHLSKISHGKSVSETGNQLPNATLF